jgi:hypothetical protein
MHLSEMHSACPEIDVPAMKTPAPTCSSAPPVMPRVTDCASCVIEARVHTGCVCKGFAVPTLAKVCRLKRVLGQDARRSPFPDKKSTRSKTETRKNSAFRDPLPESSEKAHAMQPRSGRDMLQNLRSRRGSWTD